MNLPSRNHLAVARKENAIAFAGMWKLKSKNPWRAIASMPMPAAMRRKRRRRDEWSRSTKAHRDA